jgi:hypothetical protein
MNNEEILEGNKLIALFDGYEIKDTKWWKNGLWTTEKYLEYNSSWDRLMPVIKKIRQLCTSDEEWKRFEFIIGNLRYIDIIPTFKSVVAFIEWYNLNIKK